MYKPQVHKNIIRTCSHKRTSPWPKILERHQELEGMVCRPVRMVGIKNYLQVNISTYSFRYVHEHPKYNHRYKHMQISQVHKVKHAATKTPPPTLLSLPPSCWTLLGLVCPVRMVGIKIYLHLNISTYTFKNLDIGACTITSTQSQVQAHM